jgi:hypothetical protein
MEKMQDGFGAGHPAGLLSAGDFMSVNDLHRPLAHVGGWKAFDILK